MARPGLFRALAQVAALAHVLVVFARETAACNVGVAAADRSMNGSAIGFDKFCCRFNERIEHDLQVECRATYYLEHVGGGRLLLQRLEPVR